MPPGRADNHIDRIITCLSQRQHMLCDALCKLMGDLPGENNSATLKNGLQSHRAVKPDPAPVLKLA